jgi:hypothetical protein
VVQPVAAGQLGPVAQPGLLRVVLGVLAHRVRDVDAIDLAGRPHRLGQRHQAVAGAEANLQHLCPAPHGQQVQPSQTSWGLAVVGHQGDGGDPVITVPCLFAGVEDA